MKPLVVVDCQNTFLSGLKANKNKFLDWVLVAINRAKKANRPIILVEYEGEGPTCARITRFLTGYPKTYQVTKRNDGGSSEVHSKICQLKRSAAGAKGETIEICGVNLDACVQWTVVGLALEGYRVKVLAEATVNVFDTYCGPLDAPRKGQWTKMTRHFIRQSTWGRRNLGKKAKNVSWKRMTEPS